MVLLPILEFVISFNIISEYSLKTFKSDLKSASFTFLNIRLIYRWVRGTLINILRSENLSLILYKPFLDWIHYYFK